MSLVVKSLDATSATGPGSVLTLNKPTSSFSMQTTSTGSPSYSVLLEVSIDGVNFVIAGSSTSDGITSGPPYAVLSIRANLVSISGGVSPTVTAWVSADGG